jgi:hypothetical protein
MAKAAVNKKEAVFTRKFELILGKKLVKCYIWSIALNGAQTCTLRKVDYNSWNVLKMWCWRSMEKIVWTNRVRNEVQQRVKEEMKILQRTKRR